MVNKIKKGLIYLFLSILVVNVIPNNVSAISQVITSKVEEIETYAEQVGWYYRDVKGGKQKRLWSYTYGHWLTDWIWV